jgi:predicted nucleic acid-binding protein
MNLIPGNSYLFDTTLFIDRLRNNATAKQIIQQVKVDDISAGYSVITETELWYGIVPPRTVYEHQVVLKPFKRYYLNSTIARRAGVIQRILDNSGIPDSQLPDVADCIIAATGEFHNVIVVSRNWKHFQHFLQFSIQVERYT